MQLLLDSPNMITLFVSLTIVALDFFDIIPIRRMLGSKKLCDQTDNDIRKTPNQFENLTPW